MPTTSDDLIAEGRSLARPSLHFVTEDNGGSPVAYWGGEGVVAPPPDMNWEHRLSLDCSWLAAHGLTPPGWMSVYITYDDCSCAAVMGDAPVPHSHDGLPLFGIERPCYPPLLALCLEGGATIERWLSELSMTRDDHDHPKVYRSPEGEAYERFFQQHFALFTRETEAVAGGWHIPWPESSSFFEHGKQMTLMTLRDSEPWVEVWPDKAGFKGLWRNT